MEIIEVLTVILEISKHLNEFRGKGSNLSEDGDPLCVCLFFFSLSAHKISKSLQPQQANVESSLKTKKFLISYFKFQNNLE